MNNQLRLIGVAGAIAAASAALFAAVSELLDVNFLPATIGALIGVGIEASHALRGQAIQPATATTTPVPPAPTNWAPMGAPTPPIYIPPAAPPPVSAQTAPVMAEPSGLPLTETPCPTCGLYPAHAPDPRSLPRPGTHSSFGLS